MAFFLTRFYEPALAFFSKSSRLEIYTDGSSKKGMGSWAFIISLSGKRLVENSGRVPRANNNVMEFRAAIEALNAIPLNSKATLFSDSRIVVDAMKCGARPRAYQTQIDVLRHLNERHAIVWQWIKAHNANEFNERCDELCTLARRAAAIHYQTHLS